MTLGPIESMESALRTPETHAKSGHTSGSLDTVCSQMPTFKVDVFILRVHTMRTLRCRHMREEK